MLPSRFKSAAAAAAGLNPSKVPDPNYNTSYEEYGKFKPNVHTQPYSYHGLNTRFSHKKHQQGMYRNHSLNV